MADTRWGLREGSAQQDANGKVYRLAGATVDNTDRKLAQAELARSEAEFRMLAQAMPIHNGMLDPGVDLIGKPFSLEALAAKIRLVLERPAAR